MVLSNLNPLLPRSEKGASSAVKLRFIILSFKSALVASTRPSGIERLEVTLFRQALEERSHTNKGSIRCPRLLYNVFVASSERATVAELAATLQSSTKRLEAAVSIACRLGFAKKILDPSYLFGKGAVELTEEEADGPLEEDEDREDGEGLEGLGTETDVATAGDPGKAPLNRFALMVDANLTSYLMMGSLSPGEGRLWTW